MKSAVVGGLGPGPRVSYRNVLKLSACRTQLYVCTGEPVLLGSVHHRAGYSELHVEVLDSRLVLLLSGGSPGANGASPAANGASPGANNNRATSASPTTAGNNSPAGNNGASPTANGANNGGNNGNRGSSTAVRQIQQALFLPCVASITLPEARRHLSGQKYVLYVRRTMCLCLVASVSLSVLRSQLCL